MSFESYIYATNQAEDPEALFRVFLDELESMGFDRVVYSYMTDNVRLNKKAQHGIVRNYPEDWMKYYAEKNYVNHDPVYRTALVSRRPFSWQHLQDSKPLKSDQKRVMCEAREAGLKDGVAMSIRNPMGEIVGIGLASSAGGVNVNKDGLSRVYAIVNQFHLCYSDMTAEPEDQLPDPCLVLTKREQDVLVWSAQNKSYEDIATILNMSSRTVEFHLTNIYKKLGVNGRILAVLKALRLGLISI